MIRGLLCVTMATLSLNVRAAVEVAPPPRLVGASSVANPAEAVERIRLNAKDAGDRLAQNDAGIRTRKTQADILRDLDALIQRQENPPPMPDEPMPKDSPPMPKEPMPRDSQPRPGDSPPRPKDAPKSKGGASDRPQEQRPSGSQPTPGLPPQPGDQTQRPPRRYRNVPQPGDAEPPLMSEPLAGKSSKEPRETTSGSVGPKGIASVDSKSGHSTPKPLLPLEGDVAKDVWGHLPEQLRQQVSAYYKEQFMPQYAELLRQYYSSLSERESRTGRPPRR